MTLISYKEPSMKKSVVSIMAHADDLEETAGGTLAKYIDQGYKALLGVLSRCNSGWNGIPDRPEYISSQEIVPQRASEGKAAADVLGAEFYQGDILENNWTLRSGKRVVPSFHGPLAIFTQDTPVPLEEATDDLPYGSIFSVVAGFGDFDTVHPEVKKVEDILLDWEPELVIGQQIGNFNPDHFDAAQILAMAYKRARKRGADLGPLWLPVACTEISSRAVFPPLEPNKWVDISGYEELVLKALACHKCQGGASESTQNLIRRRWTAYGKRYGVASAEAFFECYA